VKSFSPGDEEVEVDVRQPVLPVREWVAVGILVAATLLPLAVTARRTTEFLERQAAEDAISQQDRRLAAVRAALLARGVSQVGYLVRTSLRGQPKPVLESDAHYLMTRYALAPIEVRLGVKPELVFADLSVEPDPSGGLPGNLEPAERFDGGLVLLRHGVQ
jgi:hypothetical protein